jgi:hypothetical protein
MRQASMGITVSAAILLLASAAGAAGPPVRPPMTCPVDAVVSGATCMDKYEASVWRVPNPTTANKALVAKIQGGTATAAALRAGGATLLGLTPGDYAPCGASGQNCADDIYAASLPGVIPSASITWFQAQQACKNAGKRLPTNAEWQAAAAGTPDPGPDNGTTDCNTRGGNVMLTGSRSRCVSADGAFDMVGNAAEFVADWVPRSRNCGSWSPGVNSTFDEQCLNDVAHGGEPGALVRGADFEFFNAAGPLAIEGLVPPSAAGKGLGFRCAR